MVLSLFESIFRINIKCLLNIVDKKEMLRSLFLQSIVKSTSKKDSTMYCRIANSTIAGLRCKSPAAIMLGTKMFVSLSKVT